MSINDIKERELSFTERNDLSINLALNISASNSGQRTTKTGIAAFFFYRHKYAMSAKKTTPSNPSHPIEIKKENRHVF